MENTGRQIIRQQEFARKVGFRILIPYIKHVLLVTPRPTSKPTTRRPVTKPTSKPNGKPVYKVLKPKDAAKEKKGSFTLISISILLVVLSALIAFFIIRRRRSKDSTENLNEKQENTNKSSGHGKNLLDEEMGDMLTRNSSASELELDQSKEKFQQIKDRFNKGANELEPSKPLSWQAKKPGKVNPSLINNIQSAGAFRPKTEQGQESSKKNPSPQLQSKPEILVTKDLSGKDNNITGHEKSPGLSKANKDEKSDKVNSTTRLNSSATKESKKTNSPKEMTKIKHQEKIEALQKKDQLTPVDLQGDQNDLKSNQNDLQLLGGLTKTRTRGRAGRQPPSRSARKNALKNVNSSNHQM